MGKKPVNVRIDEAVLAAFDEWAERQGWSRTKAIERHMVNVVASDDPPPPMTIVDVVVPPTLPVVRERTVQRETGRGRRPVKSARREVEPRFKT